MVIDHIGDLLAMEVSCLRFFTNHIEGVIDQVLGGKNQGAKRQRANDQGWAYFASPVWSLLDKRAGAQRSDAVAVGHEDARVRKLYWRVGGMVEAPFTHDEVRLLLVEVVALAPEDEQLRAAIAVCRERGARNVHYLHGVLSRERERKDTRVREARDELSQASPWLPPVDYRPPADVGRLEERWRELQDDIAWLAHQRHLEDEST